MEEIYSRNSHRPDIPFRRSRKPVSLIKSLEKVSELGETGIIAEFKRKSPSGFMGSRFPDIEQYFRRLSENRRIAGFSVLTEPDFFNGSYDDLTKVQDLEVPILDKDFISTKQMVDNAYNSGADAILLILDFLEENEVYLLADYAQSLGMESLIEFHSLKLVDRIKQGKGRLFGYNRRNLVTLDMEPQEEELAEILSEKDLSVILESGITSDYVRTHDVAVYSGMLIGASILDGDNVHDTLL